MAAPWFFHPELAGPAGTTVRLLPDEGRHAVRSLRLTPGAPLTLFDGRGRWALAELTAPAGPADRAGTAGPAGPIGPSGTFGPGRSAPGRGRSAWPVEARLVQLGEEPAPAEITLAAAAGKGERLDWLVEKLTELGLRRIAFLGFARSVVRIEPRHLDRLGRVALAACKQSRRAWLPELVCGSFQELVAAAGGPSATHVSPARAPLLLADALADESLLERLIAEPSLRERATVVVGPEGGITEPERAALLAAGGRRVRLARGILRVETAASAAAAVFAAAQCGRCAE